ncbi:Uncharacterized protein HZ326_5979 [Fusarium oxysporum f. sp. albedinis]|nr:Uncharacterized protein HZ326_5979 [Fusarium oxysporum f. sp. albedinis]
MRLSQSCFIFETGSLARAFALEFPILPLFSFTSHILPSRFNLNLGKRPAHRRRGPSSFSQNHHYYTVTIPINRLSGQTQPRLGAYNYRSPLLNRQIPNSTSIGLKLNRA